MYEPTSHLYFVICLPGLQWNTATQHLLKRKMRVESNRVTNTQPRKHGFDENPKMPRNYFEEELPPHGRIAALRPSSAALRIHGKHPPTILVAVVVIESFSIVLWV